MKKGKNNGFFEKSLTSKERFLNVVAVKIVSIKCCFIKKDLTLVESDKFNKTILWLEREFFKTTLEEQKVIFEVLKDELKKFDEKAAVVLEFVDDYLTRKRIEKTKNEL